MGSELDRRRGSGQSSVSSYWSEVEGLMKCAADGSEWGVQATAGIEGCGGKLKRVSEAATGS